MKKTPRLLSIIQELSTKPKVCVDALASRYGVSKRVIQQDFDLLNTYFDHPFHKEGDCYFLLKQAYFYDLFKQNHKTSKQFLRFLSMVDSDLYFQFKKENQELIKAMKLDSSTIYQIENSPYEKLKKESLELLETLELAIVNRTYMTITHAKPHEKEWVFKACQVLKILYLEDNWYIALNTTEDYHKSKNNNPNSCFRLIRISFIAKVTKSRVEPKNFQEVNPLKLKAQASLHHLQTPFSKIHNSSYPVLIKISAFASVYFTVKRYLKSQRVVKKYENGDTLFEFMLTDDMEIIPLIQQWIPHLQVIEPLRIKEKIEENMRAFMKGE